VRFGYSVADVLAHVVASNQIQGAMLAFSRISDRGYQRIGYVCHCCSSTHSKAGFLMAQTKLLSNRRVPLLEMDARAVDCLEKLRYWLEVNNPDAVLTEMAELPAMLCTLGYRVPHEIGLAATSVLDGNADAGIYQNSEEVGRVAIETLIGLIYQNQTGIPQLCRETLVDCIWRDGSTLPTRLV
jgi:DNA-binding LacI/PurR family transcriptional regulator